MLFNYIVVLSMLHLVFSQSGYEPSPICNFGGVYESSFQKCLRPMFLGTFDQAQEACEIIGGTLPCVTNAAQNEAVRKNTPVDCYDGPDDVQFIANLAPNATCITNYGKVQPFKNMCVALIQMYGGWEITSCNQRSSFQCVYEGSTVCDNGWHYYNGSCYFIQSIAPSQSSFSWQDAKVICENSLKSGAHLARISSSDENDFVLSLGRSLLPTLDGFLAIGLHYDQNGTLSWVDGDPVGYTNWGGLPPSETNWELCTQMGFFNTKYALGYWAAFDCTSFISAFVCRFDLE